MNRLHGSSYREPTDIEAVLRPPGSRPGLCPIHHHKPLCAEGHLSISVIAYRPVQAVRTRLRPAGDSFSWSTLRGILDGRQRVTATFRRADGRALHVRKPRRVESA